MQRQRLRDRRSAEIARSIVALPLRWGLKADGRGTLGKVDSFLAARALGVDDSYAAPHELGGSLRTRFPSAEKQQDRKES